MLSPQDIDLWLCLVCPVSFYVFNLFFLSLVPLCRLGLHCSIRWRSAWLSCTCGPPRAHSKSKVTLITMFNLPVLFCHNNSPPFSLLLFPLTLSCSGFFCHHSLCFHAFSSLYLYMTLSQHHISPCLFSLSLYSPHILMLSVTFLQH